MPLSPSPAALPKLTMLLHLILPHHPLPSLQALLWRSVTNAANQKPQKIEQFTTTCDLIQARQIDEEKNYFIFLGISLCVCLCGCFNPLKKNKTVVSCFMAKCIAIEEHARNLRDHTEGVEWICKLTGAEQSNGNED
jgi:hypothetical protein